jgi:hypothetical protein
VNSNGTSKGADRVFNTIPAVKGVETEPATEVNRADATLNGRVDPDGTETHYYFEWGTSRRYGSTSATPPGAAVSDSTPGIKELSFHATGLKAGTTYHYRIVASSTYGTTLGNDVSFTTPAAVNSVSTDPADPIETEKATLHGKLDPDGIPTTFYFEYGKSTSYGQVSPAPPGIAVSDSSPGVKSVEYVLEGLEPGTTYHYRIVAANETGTSIGGDQVFTTKEGPAIEGVRSEHVASDSAQLLARINPHGFATEWYFEYGATTDYGSTAPLPVQTLPASNESEEVSVDLTGLANVTYHFRLIAKSEWGTVVSEDQTFEFAPPSCPNSAVRQQTGSNYLPDCRAYELVTPARAGGAPIFPPAPFSQLSGDHVGFSAELNAIPGTNPPNGGAGLPHSDFYVATRTQNGWKTNYVGVEGNQAIESHEVPWKLDWEGSSGFATDRRMEHFLAWERRFPCCGDNGSYVAFLYDAQGKFLGRLPTNAAQIPGAIEKSAATEGGFRGDGVLSGDGSKYVFSSTKVAFTPDGLTNTPGSAYVNDIASGKIEKISFDEDGLDLKQDPLTNGFNPGSEFIKFLWVSEDGSRVLMSLSAPGEDNCVYYCAQLAENLHLYMYVKGHGTYDVSKDFKGIDRGVHYAGIASEGSEVFFTSPDQMTADDTDQSSDVFRWDMSSNQLTRLSTGVPGTGNSDDCSGSWTTRCGAEVVPASHECVREGKTERRFCGDSPIALNTGEVYFYSPEQLDAGARGIGGSRNLYVWRNGSPRFVATIDGERPIQRINVSWDGKWMAFLTKTQVTPYDNAGHSEMYRYDAENRSVVCVSCRPDGKPPTSDTKASINGYFMSNDGRTFFGTEDALVNRDADGVTDTYEYVGGRPQLISNGAETGNGTDFVPIGFLGVTADGANAFFTTYQTLVGQDENGAFYKIYDARTNGGFPFEKPPAPCGAADECHGPGNPAPDTMRIGSGANLGHSGNYSAKKKKRHHGKHRSHHKRKKRGHRHAKPKSEPKGASR